ncbi:MAG: hypothetical protein AB1578_10060 [Thermodesulfobacteriota bacterium]
MTEQLEVLKDIVSRLDRACIPYMVSGSVAMNYYALPRMTRDIDLVVELRQGDVGKLERVLGEDYYFSPEAAATALARRTMFNLIHQGFMVKVDCIVRKDTEYRRLEFSRRRQVAVLGVSFHIVAPEDLILSKLDWARDSRSELQLGDVRNLVEAVADLDREYLATWAAKLSLSDLLEEVMS